MKESAMKGIARAYIALYVVFAIIALLIGVLAG